MTGLPCDAPRGSGARDRRARVITVIPVIVVIAVGGALGACARYEAALLWPTGRAAFPWTTLCVNAVGCLVIGAFLAAITEVWGAHPLLRPFFGTGVLGGFTTFSTYCADIERLVREGRAGVALVYLVATVVAALVCVRLGVTGVRLGVRARRRVG
ncbi:fluoride efflux transporter CrcB [Streptomyces sp. NBC_00820]|uniref:fluoride efflux transporter CrcB n=1 Tax=Streptomyces sp. NBC_00820 TaxID=2975842 RepID=UPI002ED43407|nr:fluoride efflux transporter CrcB [Streptomyces sp. NBC_00820]